MTREAGAVATRASQVRTPTSAPTRAGRRAPGLALWGEALLGSRPRRPAPRALANDVPFTPSEGSDSASTSPQHGSSPRAVCRGTGDTRCPGRAAVHLLAAQTPSGTSARGKLSLAIPELEKRSPCPMRDSPGGWSMWACAPLWLRVQVQVTFQFLEFILYVPKNRQM